MCTSKKGYGYVGVMSVRVELGVAVWSLQHPENWDPSSVEDWIDHVAVKYKFPEDIRKKCTMSLRGVTGKRLISMEMTDFQCNFKELGELIYMAFLQIIDVGPEFEERSQFYTDKIKSFLEVLVRSDKVIKPQLWKTFSVLQWTSAEVTQWLVSIMEDNCIPCLDCDRLLEGFEGMNGPQLFSMSSDDIAMIAKEHTNIILESIAVLKAEESDKQFGLHHEDRPQPEFEGPESIEIKSQPHSW